MRPIAFAQELLLLCWRLLDLSPSFTTHVARSDSQLHQLIVPLLYYMHRARKENGMWGYACAELVKLL